jgi:hypothetical protein
MKITIRDIPSLDEVTVPGGDAKGHRVRFSCLLGEGTAVLVPAVRHKYGWKVGAELEVETSQAGVTELKIWKNRGTMVPMLTPLEDAGDFQVRGLVSNIDGDGLIYVDAGTIEFVLPRTQDLAALEPAPGDNIMFILHGLGLWEVDALGK